MSSDTKNKLSKTTVILHWIVALSMIGLLAVGIYMEETEAYALYPWHKSFGLLILFFVVWRIVWRIQNGWPEPVAEYKQSEIILAKVVKYVLIIGTLVMPISGALMSVLGGHDLALFGLELVASNVDPNNPGEVIPRNGAIAGIAHSTHGIAANAIIVALVLHIAGAFKHHIVDKDGTLKRMLGKSV